MKTITNSLLILALVLLPTTAADAEENPVSPPEAQSEQVANNQSDESKNDPKECKYSDGNMGSCPKSNDN